MLELDGSENKERPENSFTDESIFVEFIELHGRHGSHHVHEILRNDPNLRHSDSDSDTNSFLSLVIRKCDSLGLSAKLKQLWKKKKECNLMKPHEEKSLTCFQCCRASTTQSLLCRLCFIYLFVIFSINQSIMKPNNFNLVELCLVSSSPQSQKPYHYLDVVDRKAERCCFVQMEAYWYWRKTSNKIVVVCFQILNLMVIRCWMPLTPAKLLRLLIDLELQIYSPSIKLNKKCREENDEHAIRAVHW